MNAVILHIVLFKNLLYDEDVIKNYFNEKGNFSEKKQMVNDFSESFNRFGRL
jgi:hypothetical protein